MSLAALCLLPSLALPLASSAPFDLSVSDLGFQTHAPTTTPASNYLGLVPGHTVRFAVDAGSAAGGGVGVLGFSTGLAATPLPLGSGLLLIEPVGLQVITTAPLDGNGFVALNILVPLAAPVGMPLVTQAVAIDPLLNVTTSNVLEHAVTNLQPQVLENFFKSNHPSASSQSALVISDQASWLAFYGQHKSTTVTPPAVDFGKQVVVVGFGGHFITLGYTVQIDELVPLVGGGLEVRQSVLTPGVGCGTLPSESKPGQIVVVDRVVGASPVVAVTTVKQGAPCP